MRTKVLALVALVAVVVGIVAFVNYYSNTAATITSLQASEVGQEFLLPDAPYPVVVRIESIDSAVPLFGAHIVAKASSVRVQLPPGTKVLGIYRNNAYNDLYLGFYVSFGQDGRAQTWTFTEVNYWNTGRGYVINRLGEISAAPVLP